MIRLSVTFLLILALLSAVASASAQGTGPYTVLLPLVISASQGEGLERAGEQARPEHDYAAGFLGSRGGDPVSAIAVDARGDIYIAGWTMSADFPTTPGAYDRECGTDGTCNFVRSDYSQWHADIYVVKIDGKRGKLIYGTYIGGSSYDYLSDMAIDKQGAVYLVGRTSSQDFPTTPGAFQRTGPDFHTAYVVKLAPDGSHLEYATYLSSAHSYGDAIAVDQRGTAFITGAACEEGFPTTPGAYNTTFPGHCTGYVVRLNPQGSGLLYGTFVDGWGEAIQLDARGSAYITGRVGSGNFTTTPGAFDRTFNEGIADAFVAKLSPDGKQLLYATYLGGSGYDTPVSLDIDNQGGIVVAGNTDSTDFPITPFAFQSTPSGIFVARLSPDGSQLSYSTYLGGSVEDGVAQAALTQKGEVVLVGGTKSPDFPVTSDALDPTCGTDSDCNVYGYDYLPSYRKSDAFISQLDAAGKSLTYSTFLGGSESDGVVGLALRPNGTIYFTGGTQSPDFPVTPARFDLPYEGYHNIIVGWLQIK